MKTKVILLSSLLVGFSFYSYSQRWSKMKQDYYNMTYKIPADWWADGFGMDDDWDDGGSSVCDCAGSINGNDDIDVRMAIYPFKKGQDMEKRTYVWGSKFKDAASTESLVSKYLKFKKTISTWEEAGGDMEGNEVWRYVSDDNQYGFIIYFFGKPESLNKHQEMIEKIVKSIKPEKLKD